MVYVSGLGLWCFKPPSTIFQLYRGGHIYWWRKPEYPAVNHWQNLSHNAVWVHLVMTGIRIHNFSGDSHWLQVCGNLNIIIGGNSNDLWSKATTSTMRPTMSSDSKISTWPVFSLIMHCISLSFHPSSPTPFFFFYFL